MNNKKIALITGANKGIGLETARQLGKKGITVLVGARDSSKGKVAADQLIAEGIDARALEIDVSEAASIKAAVTKVEKEFGHLDILVNNAGVMIDDRDLPIGQQPLEKWHRTFDTNVFGLIETTQAFLPLLRKSDAGRIVNLSSILGSIEYHATKGSPVYDSKSTPAYNVSKAAVNAYTVQLAYELQDSKIKVNAAHPGWVKTEMGGAEAPMDLVDGAKTSVALATLENDGANGSYVHMGESLPW